METSWLIERLDNPALLQKGDEQRLRELIATYPYFSAPYLLLARSLHEQKHPAFEQLLPLISLQAFDRKRLFRLIHEETMDHRPWTMAEGEREAVPAAGAESEAEVKVEIEGMRGLGDEENGRLGDKEKKKVEDVGADHFLPAPQTDSKSESPNTYPRFAVNFSEIEKTSEESISAVHEELQEIPFLLTIDHGPLTIADVGAENFLPEPEVKDEDEEMSESPNHKSKIINQKFDRIDFIHWLEKLQPVKKAEEMRGSGDEETGRRGDEETRRLGDEENDMVRHLREEPVLSLPKESTTDLTETSDKEVFLHGSAPLTMTEDHNPEPKTHNPEPKTHNPEPITQNPDFLIDKFIQTNPSVSRVKERFYDPAVQARESERLDDNLMTETLARIFVKQEKYERAIDAYRKLQLKYPEKSDYFAALILEINSKIN